MLRTNLSTRPFYNERAVHVGLGLLALVVLALTVVNLVEVVRLSRQNTVLSASMRDDKRATDELGRKARQSRQGINQAELKVVVAAAREANTLIDGRTFSWTALFNQIESSLPPEVMLVSVRPTIDEGDTKITMVALGRRAADVDEFIEKLEATGAFEDPLPRQRSVNEDGLTQVMIEAHYVPEEAPPGVPTSQSPAPATSPRPAPVVSSAAAGGAR